MGWSAGSGIFAELIWVVQKTVPEDDIRKEIYAHMLDAFTDADWDSIEECLGQDDVYDKIAKDKIAEMEEEEPDPDEEEE